MNINERFEAVIKELYSGNKRSFAMVIGVNPTVVENIVGKRKGNPSYELLEKIFANTNISAEWLMREFGTMCDEKKEYKKESSTEENLNYLIKMLKEQNDEYRSENLRLHAKVKELEDTISGESKSKHMSA